MPDGLGPLAVVGVSALFPGSTDAGGFWRDILAGRDLITDIPPSHWLIDDYYDPDPSAPDKTYCRRGAFLDDTDFDTVGGILVKAFGHVPRRNEITMIDGYKFRILNADSRQIHLARMTVPETPTQDE